MPKHIVVTTYVVLALGFFVSLGAIQIFYNQLHELTEQNTRLVEKVDKQQQKLRLIQLQSTQRAEDNCKLVELNTQKLKAFIDEVLLTAVKGAAARGEESPYAPLRKTLDKLLEPLSCDQYISESTKDTEQ